ncbi:MAG: septum formation family protein [Mycobacteriaceae bacterium]
MRSSHPPSSPDQPPSARSPRGAWGSRALLVLGTLGALAAGAVTVLVAGPGALRSTPTEIAAAETTVAPAPAEQTVDGAVAGTCLTWTDPDAADITEVACSEPHLFEVAAVIAVGPPLATTKGATAARQPDAAALATLRTTVCAPAVRAYLDGQFDPYGRFTVGLVNPSAAEWAAGDRTVRCGLQSVGRSGALFPTSGTVAGSDSSDVVPVGTCRGIDGTQPSDPVDCAQPHASEAVAVVDLSTRFGATYPTDDKQDAYLADTCAKAASTFSATGSAKALTVFWDEVRPESWAAGSHRVNCSLGQQLAGGGFAPVTGDARGQVAIGSSAAPPATTTRPAPATSSVAPTRTPLDGPAATSTPATSTPPPPPPASAPSTTPAG